jgi:hypothetical protein
LRNNGPDATPAWSCATARRNPSQLSRASACCVAPGWAAEVAAAAQASAIDATVHRMHRIHAREKTEIGMSFS